MNRKNLSSPLITALYCRLSLEDGRDNESMSISNQKAMLRDYAEDRPGVQRMINDVEAGKIGCVITKDLSRRGRNYIEAGSYIEIYFPRHHVRYIAVNDNVDSNNSQGMDITPFKNILNDMYSRDISKKVLTGWMARSRQGKYLGGGTPYGLMRDPEDHGHLIKDPETAPVIRMIYDLALDGYGAYRIARVLLDKKIPITKMRMNRDVDANYYSWGSSRINKILRNPVYYGAHTVCKTHQKYIRSNTYNVIPREDREIIEDCHEAIVTKEEWLRVQTMMDARPDVGIGNNCPYYNIFHGLIVCGTCGHSMQMRRFRARRRPSARRCRSALLTCSACSRRRRPSLTSRSCMIQPQPMTLFTAPGTSGMPA